VNGAPRHELEADELSPRGLKGAREPPFSGVGGGPLNVRIRTKHGSTLELDEGRAASDVRGPIALDGAARETGAGTISTTSLPLPTKEGGAR
jgi:hypothetical protein